MFRYEIYRNPRTGGFSIRDRRLGRVIGRFNTLWVPSGQVSLDVQPAGTAAVRATGRKRVHAFIRCHAYSIPDAAQFVNLRARCTGEVTYNPYKHTTFMRLEGSVARPMYQAYGGLLLDGGKCYALTNAMPEQVPSPSVTGVLPAARVPDGWDAVDGDSFVNAPPALGSLGRFTITIDNR